MVGVAFKVVKGSEFYNDYFKAKEERQKFHGLARVFLKIMDFIIMLVIYNLKGCI